MESSNLKNGYNDAIVLLSESMYVGDIDAYVKELEAFKESIENERLLSKKYRVISPYSNFPVEPTIQFYYSSESFTESYFTHKDLKKIDYFEIEKIYIKDPEYYNWVGHDYNWVCVEGGAGYSERTFNQTKFNNMIQHSSIVADFIKSNQEIKLSLIK